MGMTLGIYRVYANFLFFAYSDPQPLPNAILSPKLLHIFLIPGSNIEV